MDTSKFVKVGKMVSTPGALRLCQDNGVSPFDYISKHATGDWGNLCEDDIQANVDAIAYGGRVFSKYEIGDDAIYVITEADRSSTCVLLPSEY